MEAWGNTESGCWTCTGNTLTSQIDVWIFAPRDTNWTISEEKFYDLVPEKTFDFHAGLRPIGEYSPAHRASEFRPP